MGWGGVGWGGGSKQQDQCDYSLTGLSLMSIHINGKVYLSLCLSLTVYLSIYLGTDR